MKRLLAFGVLLVISVLIIGCSDTSVEAGIPNSYEIISIEKIDNGGRAHVLKHNDTKCFYTALTVNGNGSGGGITQMFVEKNGVSVPYCE